MTRVPLYDHAALYRVLKPQLDAALRRVLESGRLDWGPEVPAFEAAFAQWLGAAHAVGTNSGTAALKVALLALGVQPGHEVITVPNTDIGTVAAIHHVGARAVWVDVEPDTLTIDPARIEAAVTERTRVLLPVHLYGHPADMPRLAEIAERHDLVVLEDACLALGAAVAGRMIGTWGDAAAFSFAPSKHLGAYGSGGMTTTADAELAERMQLFAGYGQPRARHYAPGPAGGALEHLVEGLNERLDELQAALLHAKLGGLQRSLERRRSHAQRYGEALAGAAVQLPVERPGCVHSYRNYVVQVEERAAVQRRLAEAGVASGRPYAPPLHLQPVYRPLGHGPGSFPVAESAAERLLSLPLRPDLTEAEREHVIASLRSALG